MPRATFQPSNKSADVEAGALLLDAAAKAGVEIDAPCGGEGTCGECICRVTSGRVEEMVQGVLTRDMTAEGYVLACTTRLLKDDVTIEVPEPSERDGGKIPEEDETYLVRGDLLPQNWEYDPLAIKWLFKVAAPQPEDGLSDLDRLTRSIQRDWGRKDVECSLPVLRKLARQLREEDGLVTVTLVCEEDKIHVLRVEPGDRTTRHFGIAVDIGTTTVAVQLINLTVAEVLATRSAYNDQISCGHDIISRINYAKRPERLEELRTRVVDTVNHLIGEVCAMRDVQPEEVCNAVVSANTTMTQLFLGLNPEYIRLDPYTPTVLEVPYFTAKDAELKINPDSWICFSPNNGSYVGGDITAGLLCTDLATDTDEISLFVDIGTNGELVVGNKDFLMSCACSAGPAFEGGGIDCGMRAAGGAIERVEIDSATAKARWSTIGNLPPKGICGSGMIDLLANLISTGWIDQAGRFDRTRKSPWIRNDEKRAALILVPAEESDSGQALEISEIDIENIIRAKAAIYSACALMLEQVEITFDDLAHIYIAGSFGRYLDLEKAILLGLMPDIDRSKFRYVGNASLTGSYMVLVSRERRERQLEIARRMTYIDLSNCPGYMDEYMGALFLPHTDVSRFPSIQRLSVR